MLAPANRPPPVVTFPLRDDELGVCDTLPDRNSTGATTRITNATDQESLKTPQSVIVSWNIGLRGLRQLTDPLKPFDQQTSKDEHGVTRAKGYGSVQNLLQSLGQHVNVVCLQETKLGSAHDLTAETATPKGWDSFFSICRLTQRGKSGYAGVCVYFRKELMVLSAEEGITGVLSGAAGDAVGVGAEESESDADDVDPDPPKADPGKRDTRRASTASHKMRSRFTLDRMRELDAEGRCLVVDFGRFVLINVYVPAVTSSDPVEAATRAAFKLDFLDAVTIRHESFLAQNRHVVLCGDWNVSHKPVDSAHAPDIKSKLELNSYVLGNPGRFWLSKALGEKFHGDGGGDCDAPCDTGRKTLNPRPDTLEPNHKPLAHLILNPKPLVDVFRHHYPTEHGAYTCWNVSAGAQLTNHGSRIDFFLCDASFFGNFVVRSGVAQQHEGSDHCPVFITVKNEAFRYVGGSVRHSDGREEKETEKYAKYSPPALASSVSFAAAGRQTSLAGFFVKKSEATDATSGFPSQQMLPEKRKRGNTPCDVSIKSFFKQAGSRGGEGGDTVEGRTTPPPPATTAYVPPSAASVSPSTVPTASKETVDAWRRIQARQKPPVCRGHGEVAKVRKVMKQGANFGRVFFACPRPAGDVRNGGDCGFFQWAYDRK